MLMVVITETFLIDNLDTRLSTVPNADSPTLPAPLTITSPNIATPVPPLLQFRRITAVNH